MSCSVGNRVRSDAICCWDWSILGSHVQWGTVYVLICCAFCALGNSAAAEKTSLNSAALPLGSEAANTHNTTLGTIREEKFDPGDFVIKFYASISDMFWFVWTLLMYIADIVTDIVLAVMYLAAGQLLYFSLTISLVIGPSLAMMVFSLVLYIRDYRIVGERASPFRWITRIFFLAIQFGPFLRYRQLSRFSKNICSVLLQITLGYDLYIFSQCL